MSSHYLDQTTAGKPCLGLKMDQIFISYRREMPDEQVADRLCTYLRKRGLDVFIDKDIPLGLDWAEAIEHRLQASNILIALISEQSIRSDMVRSEIQTAYELHQTIIPVRVNFRGKLPQDLRAYLGRRRYVDLCPSDSEESVFSRLYKAITQNYSLPNALKRKDITQLPIVDQVEYVPFPANPQDMLDTGTMKAGSPYYVRRLEDVLAERHLFNAGATIIVRGPRQSGKSSLLARIHAFAKNQGRRSILVNFQTFDEKQLSGLDSILKNIAGRIARTFKTLVQPSDVWDSNQKGEKESFAEFLEFAVLTAQAPPSVLILDEVDRLFSRPFTEEFFTAVKGWGSKQATEEERWRNIHIFIGYANNPDIWKEKSDSVSPGIGYHLRLDDFDYAQVDYLNGRYGAPLKNVQEINDLMALIGGHPFLIRQSLYLLAAEKWSLDRLQREAPKDRGPFEDHLRWHLLNLHRDDSMRLAVLGIANGAGCAEEALFQRLLTAGLITGETRAEARLRCELYQQYFSRHL
jgi:hypothetical protein